VGSGSSEKPFRCENRSSQEVHLDQICPAFSSKVSVERPPGESVGGGRRLFVQLVLRSLWKPTEVVGLITQWRAIFAQLAGDAAMVCLPDASRKWVRIPTKSSTRSEANCLPVPSQTVLFPRASIVSIA
jgi:hypothetical protein